MDGRLIFLLILLQDPGELIPTATEGDLVGSLLGGT